MEATLQRVSAPASLREAVLTAALDRTNGGSDPIAQAALLLARGELRLADARPRLAVPDFEALVAALVPAAGGDPARLSPTDVLSDAQRERATRGFIRAALLSDQLDRAFGVARGLFSGPGGVLVQPAAGDPLIDLFLGVAADQAAAGRKSRTRRVLDELRLLLGPAMKPEVSARIRAVESTIETPAGTDR